MLDRMLRIEAKIGESFEQQGNSDLRLGAVRWTPNSLASSAIVRSPLTAANATFALNVALCFFRVCFMSCSCAIRAF